MRDENGKERRLSWRKQKRRLQLQFWTRFGKEPTAPDDVYIEHEQRFLGLLQRVNDIRRSLVYYREKALPEYCNACANLGADVWCVVSVDTVGKGTDAEKFRHAMCAINERKEMKNHFFNADAVLAGAIRFLDIHINAMKSVQSAIVRRERLKLDFDCYDRKMHLLRQKYTNSAPIVERNEIKLEKARAALQEATFGLYKVYAKYESERDTMLNGELEMVRQVMHSFYAKNADATNFTIAEELDRSIIDLKAEEIYKEMVAKELAAKENAGTLGESSSTSTMSTTNTTLTMVSSTESISLPLPPPSASVMINASLEKPLAISMGGVPLMAPSVLKPLPTTRFPSSSSRSPSAAEEENNCKIVEETAGVSVTTMMPPSSTLSTPISSNEKSKGEQEPQEMSPEDDLSAKLMTIRLARPKIAQIKQTRGIAGKTLGGLGLGGASNGTRPSENNSHNDNK